MISVDPETRRKRGVRDLIDAVEGHLRNEDWDSEMREALGEIMEARQAKYGALEEPDT